MIRVSSASSASLRHRNWMRNAASAEEEGAGTAEGDGGAAIGVVADEDEEVLVGTDTEEQARVVLVRVLSRLPGRPRMKIWLSTVYALASRTRP